VIHSFAGPLPSPENVILSSQNSSTQLQWKPPYYTLNQESNVTHVDPHITLYIVYITDNYTGLVVKENVSETQFTPNIQQVDDMCPTYQILAWNAGGKGKLSEPVWDSTPQGKQAKDVLNYLCMCENFLSAVIGIFLLYLLLRISRLQSQQSLELYSFILK